MPGVSLDKGHYPDGNPNSAVSHYWGANAPGSAQQLFEIEVDSTNSKYTIEQLTTPGTEGYAKAISFKNTLEKIRMDPSRKKLGDAQVRIYMSFTTNSALKPQSLVRAVSLRRGAFSSFSQGARTHYTSVSTHEQNDCRTSNRVALSTMRVLCVGFSTLVHHTTSRLVLSRRRIFPLFQPNPSRNRRPSGRLHDAAFCKVEGQGRPVANLRRRHYRVAVVRARPVRITQ